MAKQRKAPNHRPHLTKVRAVPEPVRCTWFATTPVNSCQRTGYRREFGAGLCDLHYAAAHQDPNDWAPEVRNVK